MKKKILVLGGGYGGLLSALTAREYLSADEVDITVVNREPSHQIITELHRLAAGSISEKAVALPLARLLRGKSIDLTVGTVHDIMLEDRFVRLAGGPRLSYDILVAALGSETAFFGIPGLQEHSFVLKSVNDANRIHDHMERAIADFSKTKDEANGTFIVGGGGLTGVELVGEFADMIPHLCASYGVDVKDIKLYCIEAMPSILPGFAQDLVTRAQSSLQARGVQFLTGVPITEMEQGAVHLKDGTVIKTNTLVWTGGVQGNAVIANSGLAVNRGRATVNEFLQSTSHQDVFLAGDSAVVMSPEGRPYPPTAQLSWQMGETVGYNIFAQLRGGVMQEFHPVFSGTLASLGRKDAIGTVGANQIRLKGTPAAFMKEASNIRYLQHIDGLFTLAY